MPDSSSNKSRITGSYICQNNFRPMRNYNLINTHTKKILFKWKILKEKYDTVMF